MKLYRIYTRQTEPVDNQYYTVYHVWADSELGARGFFQKRLKYAVIQDVQTVDTDEPLLLLATR